ncbi:SCO3374 family protein [Streptomyces sp. NPDC049687]|uniref:SCO3374 family protein n=1 Tax=Streptomyces sp. NPDC049687 TaxID=3365596 RepID=UPI00378FDAAA
MVGSVPPITAVPLPRRPLDPADPDDPIRGWYENELGWATVPGKPVRLLVGERFDVLEVPAEAGHAALGRLAPGSPVAVEGGRMRLLVAAGSAEELPGILQWLEWGALPLDLTALGPGTLMRAPVPPAPQPPGHPSARTPRSPGPQAPAPTGRPRPEPSQGAAVWVRPPVPGCGAEASLPTMSASGGAGDAPDLVRLVDTLATHCHRVRLRRACAQPLAFS